MNQQWMRRASSLMSVAAILALAACDDDATAPVLVAPTGVAGSSVTPTSIKITWSSVSRATSYRILRAPGVGGTFETVGSVNKPTVEFTNTGLLPLTTYRFQVQSLRDAEEGPMSVEVTVATSDAAVTQVTADITTNTTWTPDNVYQLTRIISVANGATLTITPGTKIIGAPLTAGQAPAVTALMVLRGSRISAIGTRDAPIVFTSSAAAGNRFPGDWGGLVLVGNATSNRTGRVTVEGPDPADTVSWNGGTNDADNSGSLVYVRVEFAGAAAVLNAELNAFSFYAVGSGTRLEYLQAVRGLDDQFEWFGGTVDARYLVSYEAGDDHFDAAEGYRGRQQFLIALQTGPRVSPRPGNLGALSAEQNGFEVDNCGAPAGTCALGFNSTPITDPVFANFTIVGPGPGVLPVRPGGDGGLGAELRRGTAGIWMNGVLTRWPEAAFSVFDPETNTRLTVDNTLNVRNLAFVDNPRDYDAVGATNRFGTADKFVGLGIQSSATAGHTLFANVPSAGTTIATGTSLDWTPSAASLLRAGGTGATLPGRIPQRVGGFFGGTMQGTSYIGASDPNAADKWWQGWTVYYRD